MGNLKTYEEFNNLNESTSTDAKKSKKAAIKDVHLFGKKINKLISKAKSDDDWEKLLDVVNYFDTYLYTDLQFHESIDSENAEVFKSSLDFGLEEAIKDINDTSDEDWLALDDEDWENEDTEYGQYIQSKITLSEQ